MGGPHASNNQERSQAINVTIGVVPRELTLSSLVFGDGGFLFNGLLDRRDVEDAEIMCWGMALKRGL